MEAVGPPGIGSLKIGVKIPEGIDKAVVQKLRKFCPLFIGKSGVFAVGLRILQVDLPVRHIQVPAENDRLFLFQPF